MPSDEITRAVNLVREAETLLVTAKAEANREGDEEEVAKIRESLGAAQAMIRNLEGLLALEVNRPSPASGIGSGNRFQPNVEER